MTASGSLGEQFKLYHASDSDFQPGDQIHPGAMVPSVKSRPGGKWSEDYPDHGHDQFVWMKTKPEDVRHYGAHVYEVQPEGLSSPYHWPETGAPFRDTHVSLAPVKVVRKIGGPFIGDTK